MYVCNYCNRKLKNHYEVCPGCGGNTFTEKSYLGETTIEIPPVGGYKLDLSNYYTAIKKTKRNSNIAFVVAFIFFLIDLPFTLISFLTISGEITDIVSYVFLITTIGIPLAIVIGSLIYRRKNIKNYTNDINRISKLSTTGLLVKGLKYQLENDGTKVMDKPIHFYIKVTYENANGSKIPLTSEIKYNRPEQDDTADLLIDPNDYSNYFIDFEIY